MIRKIIRIIDILLLVILIPILIVSSVLIAKSFINKENVPSFFGYSPLIVLSGSMETEIRTGDLIIVKIEDVNTLKEGDVIAFFTDKSKKTIVTHRIINVVNDEGQLKFETKGDNNLTPDSGRVPAEFVVGKYQNVRFKGLGNTAVFLQTPIGMCTAISIPVLILIISQFIQNRNNKKELEELRRQNNQK